MKNEKSFVPEEVEAGLHLDLLNYLLDYNKKSDKYFYDIHITTDGYCTIIEWTDRTFKGYEEDEARFELVDYNQQVMTECILPDNTIVMCFDEDDAHDTLENWLKENPGWVKDFSGRWYNKNETKDM